MKTNIVGFGSSMRSRVKSVDAIDFGRSIKYEIKNSTGLGSVIGVKKVGSLTKSIKERKKNSKLTSQSQ